MELGEKIKELRNKQGLTQEELADRAELSKGFISQIERDLTSPSIATLVDLLQCLGTNLKDFFSDDSDEQIVFPKEDFFEKTDAELLQHHRMDHPECTEEYDGTNPCHLTPRRLHLPRQTPRGRGIRICPSRSDPYPSRQRVYTAKKGETSILPRTVNIRSVREKRLVQNYLGKHTTQFLIISNCFHVQNIYLTKRRRSEHMANKLIDIVNVSKSYGDNLVLDELNLYIRENEFLTLQSTEVMRRQLYSASWADLRAVIPDTLFRTEKISIMSRQISDS